MQTRLTPLGAGANNAAVSSPINRRGVSARDALGARLLAAMPAGGAVGGWRSAVPYLLAGLLGLIAVYLLIRLLILDRINQETPGQEDPLFKDRKEP